MKFTSEELKRQIERAVKGYILGCCLFVLVALASIWFGYFFIRYYNVYDLPTGLIVIPIAGIILLWEMIKSFNFKTSLPDTFTTQILTLFVLVK